MPFFIRKNADKKNKKKNNVKRKREEKTNLLIKKVPRRNGLQEDIPSDDEDSGAEAAAAAHYSSEEETAQGKRLHLTKKFIAQVTEEELEKADLPSDVSKDTIVRRLKEDALEEAGQLFKNRANEYKESTAEALKIFRGHKLSITCLVISSDENYVFSGSKDCSIIKWSIKEAKKIKIIPGIIKSSEKTAQPGHSAHILSMAITSDDKFLATGCRNKIINIWNPDTMEHLKIFQGHKGAVTALTFSRGSHQLVSGSSDRSLKVWNLDEMGYVETMYGHQDGITCIDSYLNEIAITAGGRDSTVRIWKIVVSKQIIYPCHRVSIDCVCVTSKESFVTAADDGSLCLWLVKKKNPYKVPASHGCDPETGQPFWISSICSLRNTDVIASGSQDGFIRIWMLDLQNKKILPINTIPVDGFVNCLKFSSSGKYLVAGIGQEHKLGRWWRRKEAKNSVVVYVWKNKS